MRREKIWNARRWRKRRSRKGGEGVEDEEWQEEEGTPAKIKNIKKRNRDGNIKKGIMIWIWRRKRR